jgi:glycosyltransferase involved in cell wall biosynthesis
MSSSPRLLILAQVPPPVHGQSVMVGHLVSACLKSHPNQTVHVNLLLSRDNGDVGSVRFSKVFALAWCAARALVACVFRGARDVYYVPAPGKRGAVIRDVVLLTLLTPFTKRLMLHWHAVGLGEFLANSSQDFWGARLKQLLMGHSLSICLSHSSAADVAIFEPKEVSIIANGIPDPCGDFLVVLAKRKERLRLRRSAARGSVEATVRLLYLGLCTRSKGIFDVLSTAATLVQMGHRIHLTVAGPFHRSDEVEEFAAALKSARDSLGGDAVKRFSVEQISFAGPEAKRDLLAEADLFVFPTTYENEGLPLTILEALAFGLPVATTRWRGIPEALPAGYPWIVDPDDLSDFPRVAEGALDFGDFESLREWYLASFTLDVHLKKLQAHLFAA